MGSLSVFAGDKGPSKKTSGRNRGMRKEDARERFKGKNVIGTNNRTGKNPWGGQGKEKVNPREKEKENYKDFVDGEPQNEKSGNRGEWGR